jgi:hypothetical protein
MKNLAGSNPAMRAGFFFQCIILRMIAIITKAMIRNEKNTLLKTFWLMKG